MTPLFQDFRDLLVELHEARARFILVGGHAVSFHGHPRATKDLDVLVEPSPDNAQKVMSALRAFGAPVVQLGLTAADFEKTGLVVQLGLPPVRIDLLTSVDGLTFDQAMQGHANLDVDGHRIPVIGKAALLANKRAAGRPQDLADVAALEGPKED